MRKRQVLLIVAVAVSVLGNGCGTIINVSNSDRPMVFGGIANDAGVAYGGLYEAFWPQPNSKFKPEVCFGLGLVGLADLPFSVVGDTLTLPFTIPSTILRNAARFNKLTNPPITGDNTKSGKPLSQNPNPEAGNEELEQPNNR